jgi:3'-phosphoadenosine 5'-phosphosulfate sulfotransferase (PAPS reductase)/FAD synthetase
MSKIETINKIVDNVRQKSDGSTILFCSLGKDSIVTLDLIYPKFERIICVFMYFVKNLEHINRWINWVKARYPKIEFIQVPHWNLTYILRGGLYCVPNPKVKLLKLADVAKAIRLKYGIYYVFFGMKKADGMNRRLMLNGYAPLYENNGFVYPLAEWSQKDVLAYMKMKHIPQPVRYSLSASSGTGFNLACFLWLEENFPQDLEKIYKTFPLSRRILEEYHYGNRKAIQ